jgi:hypothetical protein
MATVSIPAGITAQASAGIPLSSVTIASLAESAVPADSPGSTFTFTGRAYELGPDGATFSSPVTLTFAVPEGQAGETVAVRMLDRATGTWMDVPTTFHPESDTVTVEVSHFCCFALFAQGAGPSATFAAPTLITQPVPSPAAKTAMGIFSGLVVWSMNQVMLYPLAILAVVIIAVAILLYGRRRRRNRW